MTAINMVVPLNMDRYKIYTEQNNCCEGTVHIDTGLSPSEFYKLMEKNKEDYNRGLRE